MVGPTACEGLLKTTGSSLGSTRKHKDAKGEVTLLLTGKEAPDLQTQTWGHEPLVPNEN